LTVSRLLLVRHGSTASTRRAAFPPDEALDEAGLRESRKLRAVLDGVQSAFSSPAVRARQTAEAAGLEPRSDPDLAECDFGSWTALTLDDVSARDPEGLRAWFKDPHACPHGGESLAQLAARVRRFLSRIAGIPGATVAFTHGGVVKVALVEALGAPSSSFWRIDVAPLSVTELRRRDRIWTVARTNWTVT
jgi:broad specificity phosphatase PhoE